MGLDSYLFKRARTPKAKIIAKLTNDDEGVEIAYWRKFHELNEFILNYGNQEEELNCQDIILTEENLKEILEFVKGEFKTCNKYEKEGYELAIEVITKVLKEMNFDDEEVFYHAWW